MVKLMNIKLRAATLIETIVSLIIILVIFGIVTSFLVQVSLHSFSVQHVRAVQLVNDYAGVTNENKSFFDEEMIREELVMKREIINDNLLIGLVQVKFSVYDKKGTLVLSEQRAFRVK